MRQSSGFTLIELMIVVAIIGILASIAIPAYRNYTVRSQVLEGISVSAGVRNAIREALAESGIPADRVALGLTANASDTAGRFTSALEVSNGTIIVTFGGSANAAISGKKLAMQPALDEDGNHSWRCGLAPFANGTSAMPNTDDSATATTFAAGDGTEKFLPRSCRSTP